MSGYYKALIANKRQLPLAHYPLLADVFDLMGGEPATFERASRALFYQPSDGLYRWYDEDAAIFNSNGILLERSDANIMLHSNNLAASGWATTGSPLRQQVTTSNDYTGGESLVTQVTRPSGGYRIARYFKGNSSNTMHSMGYCYYEQPTKKALMSFIAWLGDIFILGARYKIFGFDFVKKTASYKERNPSWIGVDFRNGLTASAFETSNGWSIFDADLNFINWKDGMNLGIINENIIAGEQEGLIGNIWITEDKGSMIISGGATTMRAACQLRVPISSDPDAYSLKFSVGLYQSIKKLTSPRICLMNTDGGLSVYAVFVSGILVLRTYFYDGAAIDFNTGIITKNIMADGLFNINQLHIAAYFGEVKTIKETISYLFSEILTILFIVM